MSTNTKVDREREDARNKSNGEFGLKTHSDPEIPSLGGPPFVDFEDQFTVVHNESAGLTTHTAYNEALTAAGGDENKVWTIVDVGGYPDGTKIWEYTDETGALVRVEAEEEDEAEELAVDRFETDWGVVLTKEQIYSEGVYFGDIDYEDTWVPAPAMFVVTGQHFVNRVAFLVSEEPWTAKDEATEYVWG
jgi:hypothetical protein